MRTLHLLRHAKAQREIPDGGDHARALAPRGQRAALLMGEYLRQQRVLPDLVLVSGARRTRETWDHVGLRLAAGEGVTVSFEDRAYLAGPDGLLALLAETGDDVEYLMVIGHNPDLHALAAGLARTGDPARLARLRDYFPTAAYCAVRLPIARWADLGEGGGELLDYAVPKELV